MIRKMRVVTCMVPTPGCAQTRSIIGEVGSLNALVTCENICDMDDMQASRKCSPIALLP